MKKISCTEFPEEFELQITEEYGWIHDVRLIVNNNYDKPIYKNWIEHRNNYSVFSVICDNPLDFNFITGTLNCYLFLFCIQGHPYVTKLEQFYLD